MCWELGEGLVFLGGFELRMRDWGEEELGEEGMLILIRGKIVEFIY